MRGGRTIGRADLGCGAARTRAEALRVNDRLGEVNVVLLAVRQVPTDVLGELGAATLERRQLSEHAERQGRDHVHAATVRSPGLARDEFDALAPEAQVVLRARDEIRRGHLCAVIARVGEDLLGLVVELKVVEVGDLADSAARRKVARHVLDRLALVDHLTVVPE